VGQRPLRSLKNWGPPTLAGKIFTTSAPARQAFRTSVGVIAPGITTTPFSLEKATVSASKAGLTI
jgi:hypothetical protein